MLDEQAGEVHAGQIFDGLIAGGFRELGVKAFQGGAKVANEDDLALAGAGERAVWAERFVVESVDAFPTEDIMQAVREGLLNQAIFAVDVW